VGDDAVGAVVFDADGDTLVSYRDNARDNIQSSRASRVFSRVDEIDRMERNGSDSAGATQVEGLVRDNRVEVRVLFGALAKAPPGGAFVVPGQVRFAPTFRDNALATVEQPVFPNHWEAAMSVHYERKRNRWVVRWRESGRQRSKHSPSRRAGPAS
jgi:hypothetical protein